MNYFMQLLGMTKALGSNPKIDLIKAEVYTGTEEASLKEHMQGVLSDLPFLECFDFSDILDFYAACDGCDISWRQKGKEGPEGGAIRIMPFESVLLYTQQFFTPDEEMVNQEPDVFGPDLPVEFGDNQYKRGEFSRRLFMFDDYDEQHGVALVFDSGTQPKLMSVGDNYFDWHSSKLTDFKSYFRFLVASRGSYRARYSLFSHYRGDQLAPLVFDDVPYGADIDPEVFR